MRRKKIAIIIVILLIAGLAVYAALGGFKSKEAPEPASTQQTFSKGDKAACDLLVFGDVKPFLGSAARRTSVPGGGQSSTEGVKISNCMYDAGEGTADIISLTVRGAQNEEAYYTNRIGFRDARALVDGTHTEIASEDVVSLGDAYYNPSTKQVNILINRGQYWLIIKSSDQDTSRKVGHKVLDRLGVR